MEILITGARGFIGKNFTTYLNLQGLKFSSFDRRNVINLDSIGTIVHLAGLAHDLKKVSDPNAYYVANFELTKRLFDAFIQSNASKFVFISSVKAISDIVLDELTELTNPNPNTHYGASKLMAEEYIQSVLLPKGKSIFILRPCMIHGPGNKGNLNLLYKLVSKGIPWPLASFENKRSFLSIENLCFVIKELIERDDIPSGIYNVADDEAISTNELIEIISTSLNRKSKLLYINSKLIKVIAMIGDKLHLPFNSERLQKLTESYVVSNAKLNAALGKPLPVSARVGLAFTIKSFNKN